MRGLALFVCGLVLLAVASSAEVYSSSRSYVTQLSRLNFDKFVTKHRDRSVSIVHYYRANDDGIKLLADDLDKSALEMYGVLRFGAINCDQEGDICSKERIKDTPIVRIYPTLPVPAFDHEGELSGKAIVQDAGKYVSGQRVKDVNASNHGRIVDDNPSVPKVFLFTEKKGIPLIYRALSVAFDQKLLLGIVRSSESELVSKYKIKKFPSIIVVRTGEKKPVPYNGEIKYQPIFDFLNVYSETFVPGGDKMSQDKPWLNEAVPELSGKSSADTIFKTDGKLNVIYLTKEAPEDQLKTEFEKLQKDVSFENFKYAWLNIEAEPEWAATFSKADGYPKVVVYSHGKRKKYLVHQEENTALAISNTLEKINNGDAQFTTIKGGKIPSFQH